MRTAVEKAAYTDDVPEDREELVKRLLGMDRGVVMFVGDVDTGKSTALMYVANRLIEEGRSVAIVDSDVGQKGILPPATISLARPEERFFSLNELESKACYFIGTTAPAQYVGEMAVGVWRLVSLGKGSADFVLLDTTGFVHGRGADMKRLKAELLRPELTVVLERSGELEGLKSALSPFTEFFDLKVSEAVRSYSRESRRSVRSMKWREYFSASREVILRDVRITGTTLFSGRRLERQEMELLERIYGWIVFGGWQDPRGCYHVVKAGRYSPRHDCLHAVDVERLNNLLVGLIDSNGLCVAAGILKVPGLGDSDLTVLAPLDEGHVDTGEVVEVRFGRIRVTEDGEELELLRRDDL